MKLHVETLLNEFYSFGPFVRMPATVNIALAGEPVTNIKPQLV